MESDSKTTKIAKQFSKLGASKGGEARKNVLSPEERSEIARRAVQARWAKEGKLKPAEAPPAPKAQVEPAAPPEVPYSLFTGTLNFGGREIECHVLSDSRRVFTQREVVRVLSPGGRESGDLGGYLDRNPLINKSKILGATIQFRIPGNPTLAIGYEATVLVDICDKYLEAWERGELKPSQKKLVDQAGIIIRACAKVGIIALIDEATGYQEHRAKNALQIKLRAFIAEEMQDWARMFPEEFWYELARLESVRYSPRSRPLRWGKYVMMFVYDAIDKDVGNALREKNPNPHFLQNHHQWLRKFGREKVNNQIQRVITVMKLCNNMDDFRKKFARVFQKVGYQYDFIDMMEEA